GVPVAVPAWLPAVAHPVTLSHVASPMNVNTMIAMNGIVTLANESFRFINPTDFLQTTMPVPPAGVGERVLFFYRNPTSRVVTESSTFDASTDFLPVATNLVFSPSPISSSSFNLSYSLDGATGVVLHESWMTTGGFVQVTVTAPATGQMVVLDL